MRRFLTLILASLLIASCSPSTPITQNPPKPTNPNSIQATPVQGSMADLTTAIPGEKYVDMAKQDLAARLKIDIAQITVNRVAEITGADLATGCTLKGGQVLMPNDSANGYQILLEAQGQEYLYHAGSDNQLLLCQNMNPTAKP